MFEDRFLIVAYIFWDLFKEYVLLIFVKNILICFGYQFFQTNTGLLMDYFLPDDISFLSKTSIYSKQIIRGLFFVESVYYREVKTTVGFSKFYHHKHNKSLKVEKYEGGKYTEIKPLKPKLNQQKILKQIKPGSWIISGKPGIGKSKIAQILACDKKCHLVILDNFTDINSIIMQFKVDKRPLVILLDEIDEDLENISSVYKQEIATEKTTSELKIKTGNMTKRRWNSIFDNAEDYNDLYIIMTTNITNLKEKFPVLLRDKRINGHFEMK